MEYKESPIWKTKKFIRTCPDTLKDFLNEKLNKPFDYRFVFRYFEYWDYTLDNDFLYLYIENICFIIALDFTLDTEIYFDFDDTFFLRRLSSKFYSKDFVQIPAIKTLYDFIRVCSEYNLKLCWKTI